MKKKRPTDKKIIELYSKKKMTLASIGKKYGVTKQAVHLWTKSVGLKAADQTTVEVKCKKCKRDFMLSRYRWRTANKFYCSVDCYVEDRRSNYTPNKIGYRQSRKIVKLYFDLKPRHIIHHIDGDAGNFSLENLWVFRNRKDHAVFHHCRRTGNKAPEPIWRGDQLDL